MLTFGNSKLSKQIAIFNLSSYHTCPGATVQCKQYCYSMKAERQYRNCVPQFRIRNYVESLKPEFPYKLSNELNRKRNVKFLRFHESGDIYSQEYYEKLKHIATLNPHVKMYLYTKSLHLDLYTNKPKNLNIIQSIETKYPQLLDYSKSTSRVITSTEQRKPNEVICTYQTSKLRGYTCKCGDCTLCITEHPIHVCFLKH